MPKKTKVCFKLFCIGLLLVFICNFFCKLNTYLLLSTCNEQNLENETIEPIEIDFDNDVLALMHIQKTSGSNFEHSIFSHLQLHINSTWVRACNWNHIIKRTTCIKNSYGKAFYWNRYVSKCCDMHADYTELTNCILISYGSRVIDSAVGKRFSGTMHVMTMLRDPIERYISEFRHVKRTGVPWEKSVRSCLNETLFVKNCMKENNWTDATWSDFLNCEYNQANNRQTRMLMNYNYFGCRIFKCWTSDGKCTVEEKRLNDKKILESAKQTLVSMSFFGLTEYQALSQFLFVKTFKNKMNFLEMLVDHKKEKYERSDEYNSLDKIKQNNHLDIELYEFAKSLFFRRLKYFENT